MAHKGYVSKHRRVRGACALTLAIFALAGLPAAAAADSPADAHLPGQIVVDFTPAATAEQRRQVRASVGAGLEKVLPGTAAEVLDLGPGHSVAEARFFAGERTSTVRLRRRRGGDLVGRITARNRMQGRFRLRLPAMRGRAETYYVTVRYPGGRAASGTLKLRRTRR